VLRPKKYESLSHLTNDYESVLGTLPRAPAIFSADLARTAGGS
jgi:hypothetical protein